MESGATGEMIGSSLFSWAASASARTRCSNLKGKHTTDVARSPQVFSTCSTLRCMIIASEQLFSSPFDAIDA
eukprot:598898-Prorocentrum_minimum.AAC.2